MLEKHNYSEKTWIRLINPTTEELAGLAKEYNLNPQAVQDLGSPTPRQKIETYDDFIYAVFHIPAYRHSHAKSHIQEIDFIIGQDHIITVQYDTIDALQKFSKETEFKTLLGREEGVTPGLIFVEVLKALYSSVGDEISYMQDQLKSIEDNIFNGQERKMVTEISKVSRNLLDIKRTLAPQKSHFERLLLIASKARNKNFAQYIRSIYENGYLKIYEETKNSAELVIELRETNNSLVSTKQNEVMKNLTILAFITFPLSLLAGIFGMNTVNTPILGNPNDFWYIFGFMVFATFAMFLFFKFKKWL